MNNRKYIKGIKVVSACFLLSLIFATCTNGYVEINTNPYEPTPVDLLGDNYRSGAFFSQLQQVVIPVDANTFQLQQNLVGDIYAGYMAGINSWNAGVNNSTYFFQDNWLNFPFSQVFVQAFGAWQDIVKISGDKAPESVALARILKIACFHRITDAQGPIPYTQVGLGSLSSAYDSQETVYKAFFQELTDAINVLTDFVRRNPNSTPLKAYDMVYNGDFTEWIKFANSLKLRLALRISYVDPTSAKTYAEEAVSHPIGLITANSDNAALKSANGVVIKNPLEVMWNEYTDTRMGASMQSILTGYTDPRISAYFQQVTINSIAGYYGVRTGISITNKTPYLPFSSPKASISDPIVWITASEVAFLKAEGALKGWAMGKTAQALYEDGIRLSFDQAQVSGADTYIINSTSIPANYVNPTIPTQNVSAASNITIKWDESAIYETKLERIITQKWIALYPNGQEAWAEFRRTGYPKMFPVVANNSGGIINSQTLIRRIPFPPSEYLNNAKNIIGAITLLGGPDNGSTKLWWDKK